MVPLTLTTFLHEQDECVMGTVLLRATLLHSTGIVYFVKVPVVQGSLPQICLIWFNSIKMKMGAPVT